MAISKARLETLARIKKAYADPSLDVRKAARVFYKAGKAQKPEFEDFQRVRLEGLAERHAAGGVRVPSGVVPTQLPVNWNKLTPPLFDLNQKKSWTAARKQEKAECAPKSASKEASPKRKTRSGDPSSPSRSPAKSRRSSSAKPSTQKTKP